MRAQTDPIFPVLVRSANEGIIIHSIVEFARRVRQRNAVHYYGFYPTSC
jgi:hypothetical protein